MAKRRRTVRPGFTLVDMTITMLIVAIMAAVAMPVMGETLVLHRARASAMRVLADLKYAREHARRTSSRETVSFETAADRYSLSSAKNIDHAAQAYSVELAKTPYRSRIVSASFGSTSDVTFNAYGIPDDGGQVMVQAGSHQFLIRVNADSGHAAIESF